MNAKLRLVILTFSLATLGIFLKISGNTQPVINENKRSDVKEVGAIQGASVGLPVTFPSDFPIYPNSVVISSRNSIDGSQVTSLATGDLEKVKEFYESALTASNWEKRDGKRFQREFYELEFSFIPQETNQSIVIVNYSFVPTR